MSAKSLIIAIGITAVVLIASHFFTYKAAYRTGYNDAVASIVQDSVVVDTVYLPPPEPIEIKPDTIEIKAEKEIAESGTIYKTEITIPVILEEDTIGVIKEKISFNSEDETFRIIVEDLIIKPVEKYLPILTKVYRTIPVGVPAQVPFYATYTSGFFSGIILLLMLIVFI